MEMVAKKNGYRLYIGGTWMEISNRNGVVWSGDVELPDDLAEFAEKKLDEFIERHSVQDKCSPSCMKWVAYSRNEEEYMQLQAVTSDCAGKWILQVYGNDLIFLRDYIFVADRKYVQEFVHKEFEIIRGVPAYVYRTSGFGDCTNDGISSARSELYIDHYSGAIEPEDIRECVSVFKEPYNVYCRPLYQTGRWYMAGGNFLYSSDSRFREITGGGYPISIHDRLEK